jgi:hypothetical protein
MAQNPQQPWTTGYAPAGGYAPTRPGGVTAASVLLIILGVIACVFGVVALIGAAVLSGAEESDLPAAGFADLADAAAGVVLVLGLVALAYGAVKLVSGIKVLKPNNGWRVAGIVFASLGAAFWVLSLIGSINGDSNGLGDGGTNAGGIVFSLLMLAANAIVIVLLARNGAYFRLGYGGPPPGYQQAPPPSQFTA